MPNLEQLKKINAGLETLVKKQEAKKLEEKALMQESHREEEAEKLAVYMAMNERLIDAIEEQSKAFEKMLKEQANEFKSIMNTWWK